MKQEENAKKKPEILIKLQNFLQLFLIKVEKREKKIFKYAGWIIIGGCIYYWFHFFFIARLYEPLLYTTYIGLILLGLTFINEFNSTFLNSITCLTCYGFWNITLAMIPLVNSLFSLVVGPLLHGTMAFLQTYIIFHRKIPICKRYLIWGVIFYLVFMSSYDSFHRWNIITGLEHIVPNAFTMAYSFYALIFSAVAIYFYKKKYNMVIEN